MFLYIGGGLLPQHLVVVQRQQFPHQVTGQFHVNSSLSLILHGSRSPWPSSQSFQTGGRCRQSSARHRPAARTPPGRGRAGGAAPGGPRMASPWVSAFCAGPASGSGGSGTASCAPGGAGRLAGGVHQRVFGNAAEPDVHRAPAVKPVDGFQRLEKGLLGSAQRPAIRPGTARSGRRTPPGNTGCTPPQIRLSARPHLLFLRRRAGAGPRFFISKAAFTK